MTRQSQPGIPVVNVDTHVNDTSKAVAFITGDNADGGAKAADTLASAIGCKKGKTYKVVVGLTSATATTNVQWFLNLLHFSLLLNL
jgi:ABC-type sugar transport system substrate-binding protein